MNFTNKDLLSIDGRKKYLSYMFKKYDGLLHWRADFGHYNEVMFFKYIFGVIDSSFIQVNLNRHGVILFWSCSSNETIRFNFITLEYLGIL